MKQITRYTVSRVDYFNHSHKVAVQKAYVGSTYTYILQLLNQQSEVAIFREKKDNKDKQFRNSTRVFWGKGSAGHHTQSFEYSGQDKMWLWGTKPNPNNWCIQICREALPFKDADSKTSRTENTSQTRITHVAQSGGYLCPNSYGSGEGDASRIEFCVSPGKTWFCTLVVKDELDKGYFSLYPMWKINEAFNKGTFDIRDYKDWCVGRFTIDGLTNSSKIGSIQGFEIDEETNLYFSSQHASKGSSRKIVKIPWGEDRTEMWQKLDLTNDNSFDDKGYYTEFEGLQIRTENDVYLTVTYHKDDTKSSEYSRLFEIKF